MPSLRDLLADFTKKNRMRGKGPLGVALVVTRHAKSQGLPIVSDKLLTKGGGQVYGLGKAAVQAILSDHGITRVLAEEGGRTSRGSVRNMRLYVEFLNELQKQGLIDLTTIEEWWIEQVRTHFAAQPFVLRLDSAKSIRAVVRDLLAQAEKRQRESHGTMYVGAVLQHLVGAKLDLLLGPGVEHRGSSVADQASGDGGDFMVDDVAIHVTTSPGEALLRKCSKNLDNGLRPIIVTTAKGSTAAEVHGEALKIVDRVDVFEAEQFIAGNLYELGKFAQAGRRTSTEQLIERYNEIISACETDPSLRIEIG